MAMRSGSPCLPGTAMEAPSQTSRLSCTEEPSSALEILSACRCQRCRNISGPQKQQRGLRGGKGIHRAAAVSGHAGRAAARQVQAAHRHTAGRHPARAGRTRYPGRRQNWLRQDAGLSRPGAPSPPPPGGGRVAPLQRPSAVCSAFTPAPLVCARPSNRSCPSGQA